MPGRRRAVPPTRSDERARDRPGIDHREGGQVREMPLIRPSPQPSAHRLSAQADPTVQYALGEHQTRLLTPTSTVAITPTTRAVAASRRDRSLPSDMAIDAALTGQRHTYFVARRAGRHVSRTLAEHNRAKEAIRSVARSPSADRPRSRRRSEEACALPDLRLIVITDQRITRRGPWTTWCSGLEAGAPAIARDKHDGPRALRAALRLGR